MRKTLFLVFIHGFKGGDDTFGTFPEHLRALLSHALPKVNVLCVAYPRYETRGELHECVRRFREWLENKVIDLEVANGTPSPTVDPSVHTILVGHSMGGIIAAETLISLANELPLPSKTSSDSTNTSSNETQNSSINPPNLDDVSLMFPHVQGLLTFDTPFLGLAPAMVAHGLEGGHKLASNAYQTYNEVSSMFNWGGAKPATGSAVPVNRSIGALPAPPVADAAAAPRWQSWGKYAMFAGAAGAIAAGGAAALYSQREKISAGWTWAGSHLLFIGDLAKAEVLRKRVENVNAICVDRGIGAANLFTNLGKGAREGYGLTDSVAGADRTFCNLPTAVRDGRQQNSPETRRLRWVKAVNEKAKDETTAHMSMFYPKENPGFYTLGEAAKEITITWIDQGWYQGSTGDSNSERLNETVNPSTTVGADWEGLESTHEHEDEVDGLQMREEDGLDGSIIVDKSPSQSRVIEPKMRDASSMMETSDEGSRQHA